MNKRYIVLTLTVLGMALITGCMGAVNGKAPAMISDLTEHLQETQIVPMQYSYPARQVVSYLPSEQFVLCRKEEVCTGKVEFTQLSPSVRMSTVETLPPPQPLLPLPTTLSPEIPLRTVVYFPSGSAELESKALSTLDQMISGLRGADLSSLRMVIAGYTDSIGSMEINTRLARVRADAVADYFNEKGISPTEMVTGGRPLCCYVTLNNKAEGRARNRRAEIWVESLTSLSTDSIPPPLMGGGKGEGEQQESSSETITEDTTSEKPE